VRGKDAEVEGLGHRGGGARTQRWRGKDAKGEGKRRKG